MQTREIIDHIVNWMSDYLASSGLGGFCVGVSGGIDSAVTATLCARTRQPVIALNLPILQARDEYRRAAEHITSLEIQFEGVRGMTRDLTRAFEAIRQSLPPEIQDGLTLANTRSRLRMLSLYAIAGHHRLLVAGTGNKVEDFGVGFFTKYGDGGVDISPIADLLKSEVYAIGRELGVSREILEAAPTDGLWDDNRTDEGQIGASYPELEWAMAHVELPAVRQQAEVLTDRQRQVLAIFQQFHAANRHKMDPIPVCRIPR